MMYVGHVIGECRECTDRDHPFQTVFQTSCSMVAEGGSGAARPAEHQSVPCLSQDLDARAGAEAVEVKLLTVGARDCLIEYVRCILLVFLLSFLVWILADP